MASPLVSPRAREAIGLAAVTILAAALRLPNLATRGRFEFDQAGDLLILRAFVHDGVVPLLGPMASVGDFHHGALTFYLLAPAAWLSGTDPIAVTFEMALIGVAAVLATWWLGRVMGGPLVGLVAALLLALSPAAIDESSFIWNPNPIPLFAALSAGAAWRGHQDGAARWWVLALGCAGAVAQLHVLGLLFVIPILALLLLDLRRAGAGAARRRLMRGLAGGLGVIVLLYVPLIVHELTSGFGETQAVLRYLAAPGAPTLGLLARVLVNLLRVLGWPLVGLVTDVPVLASLAVAVTIGLLVTGAILRRRGLAASRWILAALAWTVVGLAIAAPTLGNVVPGLPNDHYHAFADPLVVVGLALGGAALVQRAWQGLQVRLPTTEPGGTWAGSVAIVPIVAVVLLAAAVIVEVGREPGPDPNGGYAAAEAAGTRVLATVGDGPVVVAQLPGFEPADALALPLVQDGTSIELRPAPVEGLGFDPAAALEAGPAMLDALGRSSSSAVRGELAPNAPTPAARYLVLGCDRLFVSVLGAACGGPAEDAALPELVRGGASSASLRDRFDLGARWSISVYQLAGP